MSPTTNGVGADQQAVAGSVLVRNSRDSLWTRMQEWDYFLGIASVKRMQGLYQGTLVAQGAFSLYRTEAVLAAGGWPDAIGEDIVLTWQLMRQGARVYYEPSAVAFTAAPTRLVHLARQRARWARGMVEGLRSVRPWKQPRGLLRFLTAIDLLIPALDVAYALVWLPGLLLAATGRYWIVGPYTLAVLPLTLVVNAILYRFQRRRVFNLLGLRVRRNAVGFVGFVLTYQMLMSPIAVVGYGQELLGCAVAGSSQVARHSAAAAECLEDLIDHEGRPEQALDHRQQVLPEPVGLLPEVHQGPEDPQTVDRAPASGRAGVASVAHHHPHLSTPPGAAASGSRSRRAESNGPVWPGPERPPGCVAVPLTWCRGTRRTRCGRRRWSGGSRRRHRARPESPG